MDYRTIEKEELNRELFRAFERRQEVSHCWRKVDRQWCIQEIAFVDDWSEQEYDFLIQCLQKTLREGGILYGAFEGSCLKGFASVEAGLLGAKKEYLDLTALHVSRDQRGKGTGRRLFALAAEWARKQGAKKLYISAHSAVETQAFYHAVGCREAEEYQREHVEQEPCDCQLEYVLPYAADEQHMADNTDQRS